MENLMMFEGNEVEVLEFNGKVLFNPKHVAEILGIKNVRDNVSKMNSNQVIKLTNSIVGKTDLRRNNFYERKSRGTGSAQGISRH